MSRTLPALCLLTVLALPADAQVYKWVDEAGVTHYGERPPQGRKAPALPSVPAGPAPAARSGWQEQERAFEQRRVEAAQAEANAKQQQAALKQYCNQARDQLVRMKAAGRLYRLDENGQRVFESDAERDTAIARQEQQIAQRCR
jgi:Domain of unknown function (DUF4124)